MKQVTRNIDFSSALDLLKRVPRACLAYAGDHGPNALPVSLRWQDERYLISLPRDIEQRLTTGQEVVLLVDEGIYYFELRAIYVRGHVQPAEAPMNAPAGQTWLEVVPIKTVAWDYGMMREAPHES